MQQYNIVNFHALHTYNIATIFFTHNICDNSSISNSNSMDIITDGRGEGQKQ
jgi:hypothetical protein